MPHLFVRYYKDGLVGCCTADVGYEQIDAYLSDRCEIECGYYVVEARKYRNLMAMMKQYNYTLSDKDMQKFARSYNVEAYRPKRDTKIKY